MKIDLIQYIYGYFTAYIYQMHWNDKKIQVYQFVCTGYIKQSFIYLLTM